MSPATPFRKSALLLGIGTGLLVFAAGLALASAFLPEWRAGEPALDAAAFRRRFQEVAAGAGLTLAPGEPELFLVTRGSEQLEPYRSLGDRGAEWLLATRTAFRVAVLQDVQGEQGGSSLAVDFSLGGQPEYLAWWVHGLSAFTMTYMPEGSPQTERLAGQLLAPGETLGRQAVEPRSAIPRISYPTQGGRPAQFLFGMASPQNGFLERWPGALTPARSAEAEARLMERISIFWSTVPIFLGLGILFVVLVLKSRISVVNAAFLGLAALLSMLPGHQPFGSWPMSGPITVLGGLKAFLVWSCAESLLRSSSAEFTTSLDALRAGRLGPRGGRALLAGFGFGAAAAGLRLGLLSLMEALPGAWAARSSVELPVFRPFGSPVFNGIWQAGAVALVLALAMRVLPLRWAPVTAALAAGLFLHAVPAEPRVAGWAANALLAGVLVWTGKRHGLTALLTASIVSFLLPAAVFAALYLDWLPGSFAAAAGLTVALPLLGWIGLSRSAPAEVARLAPPAFVRRLEEERRFRHEMDLLAKMQRGLLPRTLPRIEGYELAAHSVIANEAGGDLYDVLTDADGYVWIAAGDVAGHGYSCAIAQAMTKAALASLTGRRRTPSEVLQRMDRVLRAAGRTRNFTSLALVRLQPETGEALLSNAGHPYPLLISGGEVSELALSALPLGLGPNRQYADLPFRLEPGGALVFFSDGLFEASDGGGQVYGFERLRERVREAASLPAGKLLETLLADWRRHLRASLPLDDTTVAVLRRSGGGS